MTTNKSVFVRCPDISTEGKARQEVIWNPSSVIAGYFSTMGSNMFHHLLDLSNSTSDSYFDWFMVVSRSCIWLDNSEACIRHLQSEKATDLCNCTSQSAT
jgi:hypothetical protein